MYSGRFLGGHYDSTKQRAAFLSGREREGMDIENARIAFYHKAKVRLMVDMVFSKTIVLTYAQIMDGFFFHMLFSNQFDDRFVEALQRDEFNMQFGAEPIIEIRTNPETRDLQTTAQRYLLRTNRFVFSSLNSYEPDLSSKFHSFLNEHGYVQSTDILGVYNRDFMHALNDNWNTREFSILNRWLETLEIMQRSTPPFCVQSWTGDFNNYLILAKDLYNDRFPEVMDFFAKMKLRYNHPEQIQLLDEIITQFSDNDVVPNRSDIFSRMDDCGFDLEGKNMVMTKYNDLMNKAMALQHDCGLCDEGINPRLINEPGTIIEELGFAARDKLQAMSWPTFFNWLRTHEALRREVWKADPGQLNEAARVVSRALLEEIGGPLDNGFVWKRILHIVGPGLVVQGVNYILNLLLQTSLPWDEVAFQQILTMLTQYGFNREVSVQHAIQMKNLKIILNYVSEGLYGGGSNPTIRSSSALAFTGTPAGAAVEGAIPLAMITVKDEDSAYYGINSIHRGDPNA